MWHLHISYCRGFFLNQSTANAHRCLLSSTSASFWYLLMPKYYNKSVITQDTHMLCSMATTSFGDTAGTRPTVSDPEKPKPLLLQLIPYPHIWGQGAQCHCRRLANSGEMCTNQAILGVFTGDPWHGRGHVLAPSAKLSLGSPGPCSRLNLIPRAACYSRAVWPRGATAESQNVRDRKGPQKIIEPNPPAGSGTPRRGYTQRRPGGFSTSPE